MPRWFLWTLFAVVSWGIWAIIAKLMGDALSGAHGQALSTIGILPVMVALGFSRKLTPNKNTRRGGSFAFAAGLLTCAGNAIYYDVLNRGAKAAMVIPLTALYPLVTVILAMLVLREKLNWIQVAGVVLSLASIYLCNVHQERQMISSWLLYAMAPLVLWGVAGLFQKVSTNNVSGELAALYFLGAFIPVTVLILLYQPLSGPIELRTWLLVAALGLFFALGNFALLCAFASHGKASVIAPAAGLYPLVSVPIAILFFGERISVREGAGVVVALAAVVALSLESKAADPLPADSTQT